MTDAKTTERDEQIEEWAEIATYDSPYTNRHDVPSFHRAWDAHKAGYIEGAKRADANPAFNPTPEWKGVADIIRDVRDANPPPRRTTEEKLVESLELNFRKLVEKCEWYAENGKDEERAHFLAVEARANYFEEALARFKAQEGR